MAYAHSNLSSGDAGLTGSPIDGASSTCGNSCHNSTSIVNQSGNVTLSGISGTTYTPATTYAMTLSITSSGNNGFEITAENASSKVGTFTAGTNSKVLSTNWLGQSNSGVTSWTFSYKTPAAGSGQICLYLIVMAQSKGQSGPEWLNKYCYTETAASPPTITTQPANQTVSAGATAAFSLVASGSGLTYQWQKAPSGSSTFTNISGATAASYTTPATVSTDSGSQFKCIVTNSGGSVTSTAATLTVNTTAPAITTQPANKNVNVGQTATFSVTASGTAPLSYQWQSAPSGSSTYTNLSGATSASYTTPATALTDTGTTFKCIVTNSAGSATSNAATLTVSASAPAITSQPANQNITVGQTATFSVSASGTAPLSYQWQSAPSGSSTYSNISGATSASYTTPVAALTDSGTSFKCVVTNSAGSTTTSAATLTVTASAVAPSITAQPVSQSVGSGATATFSVTANGTAPLSYQWQKAPSGSSTFSNISGATSASYTTPATVSTDNGSQFKCVVTNSVSSATSSAATLSVNTASASITVQPANQRVTVGKTASFSVTATGSTPISYQWQKAPSGSSTFSNISGATGSSYTTPATASGDSGSSFRCVVTNPGGSVTSITATLTVTPSLVLTYQWQKEMAGATTFTNLAGATSASYTTPAAVLADNGSVFQCVVTNSVGNTVSLPANLTINVPPGPPVITQQPVNVQAVLGSSATFTIAAVGNPNPHYQWYRNGSPILPTALGNIYTLPVVTALDNGARFYCVVTNLNGSLTSSSAQLLVNQPLAAPQIANLQPVMSLGEVLKIGTSYTAPVMFNWSFSKTGSVVGYAAPGAAGPPAGAQVATQRTSAAYALSMSSLGLSPGQYQVSLNATDTFGNTSQTTTTSITFLTADLSGARAYPNPWRPDRATNPYITFDRLTPNANVKIFTVSGHIVKSLDAPGGSVPWYLDNDGGDKVASGLYLYLITDSTDQKTRGKLAVIR